GVHEYWIVDADQSVIEQYRLRPASGENEANYELVLKAGQGMLHCAVIEGLSFDVAVLFDSAKNLKQIGDWLKA
ncbi:MAG: hypothetical protein AAF958_20295, partial [Planctomycetota bacterium]